MCLVFDEVPSNLSEVYWKYTLVDIKMKLKLYLGQQQSIAVQYYESLMLVAGQIFGDSKSSPPPASKKVAKTKSEIQTGFAEIFG